MSVIRTNPGPTSRDMEGHGKPKYERLRQFFVEEILAGRLKPGDMLPTEQRLADSYAIARSTVRQALAALERDGLIQRIQGKGTFIHEGAAVRSRPDLDVFALVLPEMQSGFYPSLQRSFDEAAGHVHNQMLVCQSNNSLDRQGNIILQLIDKEVAGVAIVPVTAPATPVYQIRQSRRPASPSSSATVASRGSGPPCSRSPSARSAAWPVVRWSSGGIVGSPSSPRTARSRRSATWPGCWTCSRRGAIPRSMTSSSAGKTPSTPRSTSRRCSPR